MKHSKQIIAAILFSLLSIMVLPRTASAATSSSFRPLAVNTIKNTNPLLVAKSTSYGMKAQNNILFWNENEIPNNIECPPGGGTASGLNLAVGGSNEAQVYWCAFRQIYDETHTAAIFGNILGEGAFNPVRWQYGDRNGFHPRDGGPFTVSWDTIYNSNDIGVGVIQITSMLSEYLHYINKEAPDLLKYFQDPEKYSYAEGAMSKLGDADFRRLVVLEVNFINEKYVGNKMTEFMNVTDLTEASYWWTKNVEDCGCCGGRYAIQHTGGCSSQLAPRASAAAQQLQSMSGTNCSGGSSSSGGTSGTVVRGVTTTTYTASNGKSATIAFPIAGASKSMKSQVSTLPCNHPVGCHYGPGTQGGLKDAALDLCMGNNCKEQPVVSITDGVLTRDIQTTRNGANCNHVRIKSDIDGTVIAYMHLAYEDLGLKAGDHVSAGQLIGHIDWGSGAAGAGPCNDNSMAHVHIDKGTDTNTTGGPSENARDPELVKMVNAAYEALPEGGTASSSSSSSSSKVIANLPMTSPINSISFATSNNETSTNLLAANSNAGTSFKIDPNTSAEGFWFWENSWNGYPSTAFGKGVIREDTKIDRDFGNMPYIYADNYDIDYSTWPVKFTPNGGTSTRKYYWITLPDTVFVRNDADKYVAYFENLSEPVYFITYDVWGCGDQGGSHPNYCAEAQSDKNSVMLKEHSLGSMAENSSDVGQLAKRIGKLKCFHRITTYGEPIAPESASCDGGGCDPTQLDYPQYTQHKGYTCGPSSMAMLSTVAAGTTVTEEDVISIVGSDRAYADTRDGIVNLDKMVGEKYDFEVESVSASETNLQGVADKMREYLNKGYMIHFSGDGCTISSSCGAHYVGIFYLVGDTAYIADSAGSPAVNRKVNFNDYITGRAVNPGNNNAGGGYHGTVFSAIKGKNPCISISDNANSDSYDPCIDGASSSGSSSGSDSSSSGSVGAIDGENGLTFEQAKEFAKKFGEIGFAGAEIVAPATWCYSVGGQHYCSVCKGGPGSDCTAVPYFFTGALTDLNFNSQSTQAGNYAASDIASRANIGRGTTPRVWSVVSAYGVHTWMIVGHHNGKWITIESSCKDNGNGAGTGEYGGGGVAWAAEVDDNAATTSVFSNMIPKEYAYLDGHVDLNKVSAFISGGYNAIKK